MADIESAEKKPDNEKAERPYGNVTYADPGYQSDGKARYPIDTPEHVRAALSYWGKAANRAHYSAAQQKTISQKIHAAAKRLGIDRYENAGRAALPSS